MGRGGCVCKDSGLSVLWWAASRGLSTIRTSRDGIKSSRSKDLDIWVPNRDTCIKYNCTRRWNFVLFVLSLRRGRDSTVWAIVFLHYFRPTNSTQLYISLWNFQFFTRGRYERPEEGSLNKCITWMRMLNFGSLQEFIHSRHVTRKLSLDS